MHLRNLFFFVLTSFSHVILSQNTRHNTAVIPIIKDAKTSLHKVTLSFSEPSDGDLYYLIDLDAPFTWRNCVLRSPVGVACGLEEGCRFPLPCDDTFCKEAHSYINPNCPSLNITAKYGCKICSVTPFNPISKSCKISQLTTDLVSLYQTNGQNPSTGAYYGFGQHYVLSCAPSSVLKSFPKGVRGVAAFSWSTLAFPRQVYYPSVEDKFAICLANSSSALGVSFLGDGPFYFTTNPNLDLRALLSYTPMIRTNPKSLGYYIRLNRIIVKGKTVALPSLKNSYVKLSTVVPYTTLRSDIYKELIASFSKAAIFIPQVNAVQPFSLCYKSIVVGPGSMWWRVPKIDLETESGRIWTIFGDNSMKYMGNGVSCLAFLDGGSGVKDAIVIGTHQMENNFLFFDLENQSLGFTSSLLSRGTSCSSFNFTQVPE
ncbi:aspartic peptidase A1 family [Artemisia annua]|uniref:Aspartic peptidase A1 family n=1 Tax=Artemisia annua TaxID=35608 RepID=A0A2U1MTN8_ARTAN|nr:aspartic peptidase A1 family [Artemisia annua]